MKRLFAGFAIVSLAAVSGCSQGTPGGPGTTDVTAKKPTYGQTDDTFNLSVPVMSSALQQGGKSEVSVGIKRAKNFDEDVTLAFTDIPKGLTIEPANPVIKHGDTDVKLTFQAADEAALGEFKIKVTGHPAKGGDAKVDFKLTISPKDSFTLSAPRMSTTLKQGETKMVSIGIKRAKTFDQDVVLTFGDLPTGVTIDPASPVIKQGEDEAQVTLTGADDAALGKFDIKLTGHPAKGADATNEFKLSVVKE